MPAGLSALIARAFASVALGGADSVRPLLNRWLRRRRRLTRKDSHEIKKRRQRKRAAVGALRAGERSIGADCAPCLREVAGARLFRWRRPPRLARSGAGAFRRDCRTSRRERSASGREASQYVTGAVTRTTLLAKAARHYRYARGRDTCSNWWTSASARSSRTEASPRTRCWMPLRRRQPPCGAPASCT